MKQPQINTAKDETFGVLGKKKTNHSTHSLKNAVAQKTFPLASKTETFVAPNNIFNSGKVFPISPQNAYEAQEVRGLGLDKLIQSTSKTYTSENFKKNNTKRANHVITDHREIENWMLEKLGKYNRLQNTK
jgi:DNA repair protein RadC